MSAETVGQRIRRLRRGRGWTQCEFGVEAGVSHYHTVLRWEQDKKRVTVDCFARIARALNVSMDDLYYGTREGSE